MNSHGTQARRIGGFLLGGGAALLTMWAFVAPGTHASQGASGFESRSQDTLSLHHRMTIDGHDFGFGQINSVVAGPDGRIYVADSMVPEILVLSSDGETISRFGGSGEGPGEFQQLDALAWAGDRLVALDGRARRLTFFDRSGATLTTSALPGPPLEFVGGADVGYARVAMPQLIRVGGPPAPPPEVEFLAIEPEGSVRPLPGARDVSFPLQARPIDCETPNGWIHPLPAPFAQWGPLQAALPSGKLAVAGEAQYRIEILEVASGRQLSTIRRDVAPVPLSDDEWERQPEVRALREVEAEHGSAFAPRDPQTPCPLSQPPREHYPPIRALISDGEGRLWVEFVASEGFLLEVMDEGGTSHGRAVMPDRDHSVPPYARGDLLYIVTVDEWEVQSIQVYEARFS